MLSKKNVLAVIISGFLILISITPNIVAENSIIKKSLSSDSNDDICINDREYWAILIGIKDYPGSHGDLPYSINEILSFKSTLLNGGNWNETHIRVLNDSQANKQGIFDAIGWLDSNADEDDISIFYYAGHGKRSSSNEYLQVYDETISDVELDEKDIFNPNKNPKIDNYKQVKGLVEIIGDPCQVNLIPHNFPEFYVNYPQTKVWGVLVNLIQIDEFQSLPNVYLGYVLCNTQLPLLLLLQYFCKSNLLSRISFPTNHF